MKKWDIFSRLAHIFSCSWKREWAGYVVFKHNPGGFLTYKTSTFVVVERCCKCNKIRITYVDSINVAQSPDVDKAILASEGQIPYKVGSHECLTPDWGK